jgi:nitrogen fixation protein NifU and related proteins
MSTLEDLYRQVILEHNRNPRNFRRLDGPCDCTDGINPLCGDRLRLCVHSGDDRRIRDIGFEGAGCAISLASASMLTEAVQGLTRDKALALADAVEAMLAGQAHDLEAPLAALSGVQAFPTRIKCATLAWHALRAVLTDGAANVTTEQAAEPADANTTEESDHVRAL